MSACIGTLLLCALPLAAGAQTAKGIGGVPCHAATAAEAASVPGGAIITGVTQVCPGDAQIGINADVGQAKQYLKSLPRTGSATDDSNMDKENDAFAICAANFLKEYQQRYGGVQILAAYRSPAYDAKMCVNNPACGALMNNPNPNGNHQRGLAMDVKATTADQQTLALFARNNPQFGVCFPFTLGGVTGAGTPDTVHMILAGGPGSESSGVGCRGVTRACDAGHFDPNSVQGAGPVSPTSPTTPSTPTSGFGDLVRQYLGGGQQPQTGAIPATGAQSYPYSVPATITQPGSGGTPASAAVPATTGVSGTTAVPAGGSVPVSSVPTTIAVPTSPVSDTLSTNTQTPGSTTTSAIDLIGALANPSSAAPPQTPGAPLALNGDLQNNAGLVQSVGGNADASPQPGAYTFAPAGTQTFTSEDLQYGASDSLGATQNTTFGSTLDSLKRILIILLGWLQPFGAYGTPPAALGAGAPPSDFQY